VGGQVITLGQHGKVTGQQPGSLDSARGSNGHSPQVAGTPPIPPAQRTSSSDFDEVHVRACSLHLPAVLFNPCIAKHTI